MRVRRREELRGTLPHMRQLGPIEQERRVDRGGPRRAEVGVVVRVARGGAARAARARPPLRRPAMLPVSHVINRCRQQMVKSKKSLCNGLSTRLVDIYIFLKFKNEKPRKSDQMMGD